MSYAPAVAQHDDTHDLIEAARAAASETERALLEDEVVRRHLGLAQHLGTVCRPWRRPRGPDVASFALVKAIRGFNHDRGEFVPFATVTILGEIKKYFRDYCWGVRPPRRIQQMQADISSATERCLQADSRQPGIETLADELDAGVDDVREAMAARSCFSPTSLDQPVRESGRPLGETIASEGSDYDFIDDWVTVGPLCRSLSDDERELLRLRFVEDKTQQEIAEMVGVSQMQISRRLAKLLGRLRESAAMPDAA